MTVVVDDSGGLLKNNITHFLRRLNTWEYKGPNDSVDKDALDQALGYMHQKSLAYRETTDPKLGLRDRTVTIVCHRYPRELFKSFEESEIKFDTPEAGVYQIDRDLGVAGVQFVVICELDKTAYPIMHALDPVETAKTVNACFAALAAYDGPGDARYARRIVNYMLKRLPEEVVDALRREKAMNKALLEYANADYVTEIRKWQSKASSEAKKKRIAEQQRDSETKRADSEAKQKRIAENKVVELEAEIDRLRQVIEAQE